MTFTLAASTATAATSSAVSPQGEVSQVEQVSVKFSEAVVAPGDFANLVRQRTLLGEALARSPAAA